MSDVAIRVEGLGKMYRIGAETERTDTFRDAIVGAAKGVARNIGLLAHGHLSTGGPTEEFWALKDVDFEIKRGEAVGIIGRNGAGKSTLLKILSRITEPTTGRITMNGRVASLLEVGTGFHPELTGRENIYLNGAIIGMTRAEIRRKFDEIVDFAGVEKFLDTPVKRYSSGMGVRLGFAVAAHLEPEILIVDEVLAVGDAEFQKKCLGKMNEVAGEGRTVLFVSHNMAAVERLCQRAIALKDGGILLDSSSVKSAVSTYFSNSSEGSKPTSEWINLDDKLKHPIAQPLYFAVKVASSETALETVSNDTPLVVEIHAKIFGIDPALNFGFALYNEASDLLLWSLSTDAPDVDWPEYSQGLAKFTCSLPSRFLNEGKYRLEMISSLHNREWIVEPGRNSPIIHFTIRGGLSNSPYWTASRPGILAPVFQWACSTEVHRADDNRSLNESALASGAF